MASETNINNSEVKKNVPKLIQDGYNGDKGPKIGARHVQIGITALGVGIAFAMRISLSVAILAMTDNSTSSNADVPTYDWNNKSIILSALFWGALCFPLVSGYLGNRFGPKWFHFGANLVDSVAFLLIPLAAKYGGSTGVIICRIIEGLAQGMLFPMNTCYLGNWVPTEERSTMGFYGAAAMTFFNIISSSATGIISDSYLGWPWVFYIFGTVGLLWCALFAFVAQQNPESHPRITAEEKKYIQMSLGQETSGKVIPTPWKKIFTSVHVWAIFTGQIGVGWVGIILQSEMSIFLTKVEDYSVKNNGLLSSIPPLCGTLGGLVASILSDYIIRRKFISVLSARRTFHTIGQVGISACFLTIGFVPAKYATWAVVIMCFGEVFLICTAVAGATVNTLDISPRFAGIIFGCYSTISQSIALIAPILIQLIVTDESNAAQWRIIFTISAVVSVTASIIFDIFATAERQPWNGQDENDEKITSAQRKYSVISISSVVIP